MSASRALRLRPLCKYAPVRLHVRNNALPQQVRRYTDEIKDKSSLGGPKGQVDPFGKDKAGRTTMTIVGGVVVVGGIVYALNRSQPSQVVEATRNAPVHVPKAAFEEMAGSENKTAAEKGLGAHRAE